jgi:toxin CptA
MSSPGFSATIELRPRPSLRAVQWLLALHVLAIALVFLAEPPKWIGLGFAAALFASWQLTRRAPAAGYGPKALTRLIWHADSTTWTIETASGSSEDAELLGSSLVQPWLIVLRFRLKKSGRRSSRALLGDELDAELLQRLRRRLLSGSAVAAT